MSKIELYAATTLPACRLIVLEGSSQSLFKMSETLADMSLTWGGYLQLPAVAAAVIPGRWERAQDRRGLER